MAKKKEEQKYYSLDNILTYNATYNMLIGERSNGKSYAVNYYCLKDYLENKNQMAMIRRWDMDFRGKQGQQMFANLVSTGALEKLSKGKYKKIVYQSSRWYLCTYDEETEKYIAEEEPFAYAFALNTAEHDKSASFPQVKNIFFDEFMSRDYYLNNEFVIFMNVLSTIIRDRDDVKIFMAGNTVNQYSPYFSEMGLTNIKKMKKDTIDIYTYNEGLTVAVEYTGFPSKKKKSDKYFAFDNPKLSMITRGEWEIGMYPHLPEKYKNRDILFKFFIIFDEDKLQCEVIGVNDTVFLYIHRKTTEIQNIKDDIVYSQQYSPYMNWRRKISKPIDNIDKKLYSLFKMEKVFYQDNEVGEIVRNYLMWCETDRGII